MFRESDSALTFLFQVHMVAAGVPGLPSLPSVGHSGPNLRWFCHTCSE